MKRRLLPALFLAVQTLALPAQNTAFVTTYYPQINRAELSITEGDYQQALRDYQTAFAAVPSGFARDYHNAALCAQEAGQPAAAFVFLEKMALKGVTLEHFKNPVFSALHDTPLWPKFLAGYTALHRAHLDQTDLALRRELTEMADLDQLFRQKEGSYAVYGDTIRHLDSLNILRLRRLLTTKGFPSDDRIGTDFPGEPIYNIVLHHHAQHLSEPGKYAGWPDLAPDLIAAAQAGEMEPKTAAYFLEMQNDPAYRMGAFGLIGFIVNGVKQPDYYLDAPADAGKADQLRLALGLESLADFKTKCAYGLGNPDQAFRLNDGHPFNFFEVDEANAALFKMGLVRIEPRH